MMKWKVVKNPRSSSADRSLECLKNDVQQSPQTNNANNDSNNNVGEESKQDSGPPTKDTNKRESSLVRKSSVIATECINLKSILGLTRQRSETNLSSIGLISTEPRRSRSEVRGISCDRLTIGYHTTPGQLLENGKTRSSSPPSRTGWLRGRKRERESRNLAKGSSSEIIGKTIVTGSNRKRTSSKSRNGDCRTIVDGSNGKQKSKLCLTGKSSLETRKIKCSSKEDIIEEEIYTEIHQDNLRSKLLEESNKDAPRGPSKVIRKKGMAPKPQITTVHFNDDVNLVPNGRKDGPISLGEAPIHRKPPRKIQTYSGRNQDRKSENRAVQPVKLNNLRNSESALVKAKNNINSQSVVAVAEIHKELLSLELDNRDKIKFSEPDKNVDVVNSNRLLSSREPLHDLNENGEVRTDEPLPFHIDTPDYSTLESVNCNSYSLSTEDITISREDVLNCNTDCDESLQDPLIAPDEAKVTREISLSSILRDSTTGDGNRADSEPKKTVRFEKLDLIEKYKKHKTEGSVDTEDDEVDSSASSTKVTLDVNSNEVDPQSILEDACVPTLQCSDLQANDVLCEWNGTTVIVQNSSPVPQDSTNGDSPVPFVVKKSFVLTIAKQEKGFRSLCANKRPEPAPTEQPTTPTKGDHQISVTFLCSGPPSENWVADERHLTRSTSVPPPMSLQPVEVVTSHPAARGRSRERKPKERQSCKKNNKAKKKDAVFVMPQAVIDELSQVLEKRKPSLDEIPVHP